MNLSVPAGSIFGFIGKNGAGKTAAMKAVLGLIDIDSALSKLQGSIPIFNKREI